MLSLENYKQFTVIALIGLSILGFLSIRGITNIATICLAAIGLWTLIQNKPPISQRIQTSQLIIICVASGSLLIAVLLSQLFKNPFQASSFDGPSRIFLGFFIFIALLQIKVDWIKLLSVLIPVSLLFLCLNLMLIDKAYIENWGGRYASYFVDPNTLGGQTAILSMLCWTIFFANPNRIFLSQSLLTIGFVSGFILLFYAKSRGGWLAFIIMLVVMILLELKNIRLALNQKKWRFLIFIVFNFLFISIFLYINQKDLFFKLMPIGTEITLWKNNALDLGGTAVGSRLGMWEVSSLLIVESLPFGFGERSLADNIKIFSEKIPSHLNEPLAILIGTGPHSDILAKGLAHGTVGIFAYCLTLGIPAYFFLNSLGSKCQEVASSARLGLIYLSGVFVCGLSNETLSLKYLCSFFAMMIAILLASTLSIDSSTQNEPQ